MKRPIPEGGGTPANLSAREHAVIRVHRIQIGETETEVGQQERTDCYPKEGQRTRVNTEQSREKMNRRYATGNLTLLAILMGRFDRRLLFHQPHDDNVWCGVRTRKR